jgi:hypothetical protein
MGVGRPYIQFGRAIRYAEQALLHWMEIAPALLDE